MFNFTSKKFYDEYTGTAGGGVGFLNGCIGDKITCVVEGYFYIALEAARLTFTASSKIISFTNPNPYENRSIVNQGFQIGDTFDVIGTASNDGSFTIINISDKFIEVSEMITDEVSESCGLFDTTKITALNYYYDLIDVSANTSLFVSKTDKGTMQRYISSNLDASVSTPVYAIIGTDSYGWVTDTLTDNVSQTKIEGQGIVDYKQKFKVTQIFYIAPIWSVDLRSNFSDKKAPDYFQSGNSLRHVCGIEGKYDYNSPIVNQGNILADNKGFSAWFNQNSINQRPNYYCDGVLYQDHDTSEVIDKINPNKITDVTLVIKNRNSSFINYSSPDAGTSFILSHFFNPNISKEYTATDTTLLENIKFDRKFISIVPGSVNGDNYGTQYQSLTNISITFINDAEVHILFSISYSDEIKEYLKNKIDGDRYYSFAISTQNFSITSTKNTDRVNILCDYQTMNFDKADASLMGLKDYLRGYPFPNSTANQINNVTGFEGDFFYESIPFWLETAVIGNVSPTLQKVTIQIIASKESENDFIIEEKIFDTSLQAKLKGIQNINLINNRGFILPDNSPYNKANIIRKPALDSGTKAYYDLQYGFVLRYEYWRKILQSNAIINIDILKDIQDVNEQWHQYSQDNDWNLKFRVIWDVLGYDQNITTFQADTDMIVLSMADNSQEGPSFEVTTKFYDINNVEVPGIIKDDITRIVSSFVGNVIILPSDTADHWGYLFTDNNINGGIFNRRFATTEFTAESDSPFTTVDLPANGATAIYGNRNLRLSYFDNRIELDTFFSNTNDGSKLDIGTILVAPRIGYKKYLPIPDMRIGYTFRVS